MPVKNVCDALCASSTVAEVAGKLSCSRGYIYKVLKEQGMSPKALTKGSASVKDCPWGKGNVAMIQESGMAEKVNKKAIGKFVENIEGVQKQRF